MERRQKRKHERMTVIEAQIAAYSKPQLLGLIAGLEIERDEARALTTEPLARSLVDIANFC